MSNDVEKRNCLEEQAACREASERFSYLDQRKKEIGDELKNLHIQHAALIEEAKAILQKNLVLGIISPDSKGGKLLDYLTDSVIGNISNDRLRENAQNMKRIRARIEYLTHQLALINAQLSKAVKDVLRTKREMEICQGR
ncbi:MAG: hypothetical protein ACRBDI_03520 [Alphaproteobacteria bacterium]